MSFKAPNTNEIARQLGISRATVSNVINQKGRVSAETRKRVEKALAQSGYVRDRGAVALKTGRSSLIGVLVTDIANPFYGDVISDLESHLADAGYSTILGQSRDSRTRQAQLLNELLGTGVAGLIVNPCRGSTPEDFELVTQRHLPLVLYVRDVVGCNLPVVSLDDRAAGTLLANHMLAEGYKRFAVIGGFPGTTSFDGRLSGVQDVLLHHQLEAASACPGPITEEFGYAETRRLLEAGENVDGIIGHNDLVALGCLRAVRDIGRIPGSDIGLAGFDNLGFGRACDPQLTTIALSDPGIGSEAARLLLGRIGPPNAKLYSSRIKPKLIVRGSTRKNK